MYDYCIIGAGSAGVHTAYFLQRFGAKVAVVEKGAVAAGGSGAAGAFVSPRLGRGGPIQRWSNEAFQFCVKFYEKTPFFYQTGLLRLPKEGEDFDSFEPFIDVKYERKDGGFYFPQAGIVKAKEHLESLLEGIDTFYFEAKPIRKDGYWEVGRLRAKEIVLATGSDDELLRVPYLSIGKTSGVRFDVRSDLALSYNIHKKVSVSANIDGIVAIGATHHRLGSKNPASNPLSLFEEAKRMVGEFRYEIEQMYCGVRSSVNDHLPVIGSLYDLKSMPRDWRKIDGSSLPKSGRYIIGGLGGRGFVFGPFAAMLLARYLLYDEPLPEELNVVRFIKRYIKRGGR
ncbi:MAG: FAD-dependent oxidoreductase [Epsilonproteobacteria bacterium]|nr:FAD-dependent oxidoreductase [Campylobacterota bacterium]NPA65193.1 FAD-dependent oxidoreductase [Campylobacterota bacterium]